MLTEDTFCQKARWVSSDRKPFKIISPVGFRLAELPAWPDPYFIGRKWIRTSQSDMRTLTSVVQSDILLAPKWQAKPSGYEGQKNRI